MGFTACAVLPAGGIGERTGLPTPKQFCLVSGKPLISYTLAAFEKVPWILEIVVPVAEHCKGEMEAILARFGHQRVKLVTGGATRHRSIANGVYALSNSSADVVIIHDAVRPLVDQDALHKVAAAAYHEGAAGMVRPLVSTVVKPDKDGFLESTLIRQDYRGSEMPQAFRYTVINHAYHMCTDEELDYGTECLELARKYGRVKVKLLDGSDNLWKVTYSKDLHTLEGVLKAQTNTVLLSGSWSEIPDLCNSLEAMNFNICHINSHCDEEKEKYANIRAVMLLHRVKENTYDTSIETRCQSLLEQSTRVVKYIETGDISSNVSLIHVFTTESVSSHVETSIRQALKKFNLNVGNVYLNGVLCLNSSRFDDLVNILGLLLDDHKGMLRQQLLVLS